MVLADLRDDAPAHLHGYSVDDASRGEHHRDEQDQQNRSRHQRPPLGYVSLPCHPGANVMNFFVLFFHPHFQTLPKPLGNQPPEEDHRRVTAVDPPPGGAACGECA